MYVNEYYGDSSDPDTAWTQVRDGNWGPTFLANFSSQHGNKPLAFPEFGIGYDDFGEYVKLMEAWFAAHNVLYATLWNNNGGGYAGKVSDGTYPQTGQAIRHFFNQPAYPVEPLPYPTSMAAVGSNGAITISGAAVASSAAVTGYNLYAGTSPTTVNASTVVATSSTPNFTQTVSNGTSMSYAIASINAAGNVGQMSPVVTAAAQAAPANQPAHYLATGSTGFASTPVASNQLPGPNNWSITVTHCPQVANAPNTAGMLAGVNGNSGDLQSLAFFLETYAGVYGMVHNSSNQYDYDSYTAPNGALFEAVGQCYTDAVFVNYATGQQTFFHGAAGGSLTNLGENGSGWVGNIQAASATYDPNSNTTAYFKLGQDNSGNAQYVGYISEMKFVIGESAYGTGGTVILHPVMGASSITDATGAVWTIGGGAVEH